MKLLLSSLLLCGASCLHAQEANAGLDVRATVTAQTVGSNLLTQDPRDGALVNPGFRIVVYPTIKFSEHLSVTAALQSNTRTYFSDSLTTPGNGVRDYVLQASVNYARVSPKGSLQLRAGVLPSAFGSFLLRYDDADNPLANLPPGYGYYYAPVAMLGVASVQADVTRGKWDARLQLASSSPSGPRSIFTNDQYANWAGGVGYTVRQGFRIGVAGYHGPYLNHDLGYIPGELEPNHLPASALGAELEWARGYWKVESEWQWSLQPWTMIPTTREHAAYVEARRTLSPRWYAAVRGGFEHVNPGDLTHIYEAAAGFRPNRLQLIKAGYEIRHTMGPLPQTDHIVTLQVISSLHLPSFSRH